MSRSFGHVIPINLDPPPCCRLGETEESSLTHDPAKQQQQQTSRFEVVKAPDDLGNGLILTDTAIQRSSQQQHQQLQLITLLPSPEPRTPVSIQSTETDEVWERLTH